MNTLKVKKTLEKTKLPSKREGDSGYDIYVSPALTQIMINPGQVVPIATDLRIEIPVGYTFVIKERGSTGSIGLAVRAGVVDSNFRGEIVIMINNTTKYPIFIGSEKVYNDSAFRGQTSFYNIEKAIAQGVIIKNENWEVLEVAELSETDRGSGMIGSTKK
jgi:dUTP pyrophosphatase